MALLADGRLHLQHGPIDLVIEAWGEAQEVRRAYEQAAERFATVLNELVGELPLLRAPLQEDAPPLKGAIARMMLEACWPFRSDFITPMAAVAGSVADTVLAAMIEGRQIAKALVNNGGDIALHIGARERIDIGVVGLEQAERLKGIATISANLPVRGVATSGWRGRSQSLGIADSVTVFAATATKADAAATMIANAVNAEHPAIRRLPAKEVKADSDLGDLPVTVAVGALPDELVKEALDAGATVVEELRRRGLVFGAFLTLQGRGRLVGCEALVGVPMRGTQMIGEKVA